MEPTLISVELKVLFCDFNVISPKHALGSIDKANNGGVASLKEGPDNIMPTWSLPSIEANAYSRLLDWNSN